MYIIVSDRWSQYRATATLEEIQEQVETFDRDRLSRFEPDEFEPVRIEPAVRRGCDVLVDETGDVVAVVADQIRRWDGEYSQTFRCDRCGGWIEFTFSNGTRYDEVAGTFHNYRTSGGIYKRCVKK